MLTIILLDVVIYVDSCYVFYAILNINDKEKNKKVSKYQKVCKE